MSRHLDAVATSTLNLKQLRHQLKNEKVVATIIPQKIRLRQHLVVAKSIAKRRGRDNNCTEKRSRQHQDVATTIVQNGSRDNTRLSRQHLQGPECRDVNKLSRHQVSMRRHCDKSKLSRHHLHLRHVATTQRLLQQGLRQGLQQGLRQGLMSRRGLYVATISVYWASLLKSKKEMHRN